MRKFVVATLLIAFVCGGAGFLFGPAVCQGADSAEAIRAAFESHDRAIHVKDGWMRDPYIVRGDDGWYYLTGTTQMPDTPLNAKTKYNTGLGRTSLVGWVVQVWRTKDFINWEPLGIRYTLKDGIWFEAKPRRFKKVPKPRWHLWAPELHDVGDRWALVHTSPRPVKGSNLSLSAGEEISGPWSNPMGTAIGWRHDPSLFQNDDGTWWMIWGATKIAPLKEDFSGFTSEPITIGPAGEFAKMGHEGCLIRKIGGTYVLFGTGWSTGKMRKGSYNLYYATADKIAGPYGKRKFVGRFLGHGTPFRDDQGRWWCTAFFNANAPPLPREGISKRDLSETAQTINPQGVTLVPLRVTINDGKVTIRAKDPAYRAPGPDERQEFDLESE